MAHFTGIPYSGSFSASGSGIDPSTGYSFTVKSNGALTTTLTLNANGSVTGTWSYSGTYTASSKDGSTNGSVGDSGSVSGTEASLTFTSSSGVLVNGKGHLTNSDKTVAASFGWHISGVGGSASGSMSGNPGQIDSPAEIVSVPAPAAATETSTSHGMTFVSPQYNFDSATGSWSLASTPAPGSYSASDATWLQGSSQESYLNSVSQSLAWGAILSSDLGASQDVKNLYESASTATTLFNIQTTYLDSVLQIIKDVPNALAYGTGSDIASIEARIGSANDKLQSDVHQAAQDAILDSIAKANKAAEYILNFYRSAKIVQSHSAEFFTLQTGSDSFKSGEHNVTIIGSQSNDIFTGGAGNDVFLGMGGNDSMVGGSGNNTFIDGTGKDTMIGGSGNDTYYVSSKTDVITEKANAGTDTVILTATDPKFTSYTLPANIENLTLNSSTIVPTALGNSSNNVIIGNGGTNTIDGGGGLDALTGGGGNDTFVFDTKLNGIANVATITDFVSGQDSINLSKKIFSTYKTAGADISNDFLTGAGVTAQTKTQHFLYDTTTGNLYYDADGSDKGEAVLFVTLTGHPTLVASDLHIY